MLNKNQKLQFEELAMQYMDSLYTKAIGLTKSAREAETLIQKTYLQVFQLYDKVEGQSDFKVLLFSTLESIFTNQFQRKKVNLVPC